MNFPLWTRNVTQALLHPEFPVDELESVKQPKEDAKISEPTVRLFADAGFASNSDLNYQLAMIIQLMDKLKNAYVIYYASWKSH